MELKPYQSQVLKDLESYLESLSSSNDLLSAFESYWSDRLDTGDLFVRQNLANYKNAIEGVPHVCVKVPTAGGKTFIATNSISILMSRLHSDTKTVLWLVPSITILEQTIKNLSDTNHPYRQKLNSEFQSRVEIYTKEKLLQGVGFNPVSVLSQLNIIVLSFDSLRAKKKEDRKIYQENGSLYSFQSFKNSDVEVLEGADETSLVNVIRKLNPVVIVDESHNAESELSVEMLKNVNPRFILDLTATPRKNSNIISFVNISEMKKENMVKLPVIVYNHISKDDLLTTSIELRNKLEDLAKEEEKVSGKYIRPILLLQAEPKNKEDTEDFEKIKSKLVELGIPEDQIKIKTANINQIKGIDLLSKNCKVRYIITIDALKEGWDCPFAYILATYADKNSVVSVEQVLGRILRLPNIHKNKQELLNLSYVFTASNKFKEILETIVQGMNQAGFSAKEFRAIDLVKKEEVIVKEKPIQGEIFDSPKTEFESTKISSEEKKNDIQNILDIAKEKIKDETNSTETKMETGRGNETYIPPNIKENMNQNKTKEIFRDRIIDIKLPSFYFKEEVGLFSEEGFEEIKFDKKILLKDFKLGNSDSNINFNITSKNAYQVDLEQVGKNYYKTSYKQIEEKKLKRLEEYILNSPKESRTRELTVKMQSLIGSIWPIEDKELTKYLNHIFENFTIEQIKDCLERIYTYKDLIKNKIEKLTSDFVKKSFYQRIESSKIFLKLDYPIPLEKSYGRLIDSGVQKSLYNKENEMNHFEKEVVDKIANLNSVLTWTKNIERKDFYINGFINHYPDFILIMNSGKIVLIETKGDYLDNSDSAEKLELGKKWADKAGDNFRYMMIFPSEPISGAYLIEEALDILKEI